MKKHHEGGNAAGASAFQTPPMSDDDIRRQLLQGKEDALDGVMARYGPLLLTLIRRRISRLGWSSEDVVEELGQEVFLKIWKHIAHFNPKRGTLRGWMAGIVKHTVTDFLRTSLRERDKQQQYAELLRSRDGSAWSLINENHVQSMLVRALLAQLPPRSQTLLVKRYFEDLPYAEIANDMKMSVQAAKMGVRRALDSLRTMI